MPHPAALWQKGDSGKILSSGKLLSTHTSGTSMPQVEPHPLNPDNLCQRPLVKVCTILLATTGANNPDKMSAQPLAPNLLISYWIRGVFAMQLPHQHFGHNA